LTLAMFAGLAILYLQRSSSLTADPTPLWRYALAATGCALANYLGNHGQTIASILVLAAVVIFILVMLRPFSRPPSA